MYTGAIKPLWLVGVCPRGEGRVCAAKGGAGAAGRQPPPPPEHRGGPSHVLALRVPGPAIQGHLIAPAGVRAAQDRDMPRGR